MEGCVGPGPLGPLRSGHVALICNCFIVVIIKKYRSIYLLTIFKTSRTTKRVNAYSVTWRAAARGSHVQQRDHDETEQREQTEADVGEYRDAALGQQERGRVDDQAERRDAHHHVQQREHLQITDQHRRNHVFKVGGPTVERYTQFGRVCYPRQTPSFDGV